MSKELGELQTKRLAYGEEGKDERFENVILFEHEKYSDVEEYKTTAENDGDCWRIRDWELTSDGSEYFWFCRSMYTIQKDLIKKLANTESDDR